MPIRPENRDRYPADWKLRSRFVRFIRSRGLCEWCGLPQYAVVKSDTRTIMARASTYAEARQNLADLYASRFGMDSDEPCPWSIIVLTTAHVFDDRPEASSLLNLAALCQKCHNGHDMKARAAGRKERRLASSGQGAFAL